MRLNSVPSEWPPIVRRRSLGWRSRRGPRAGWSRRQHNGGTVGLPEDCFTGAEIDEVNQSDVLIIPMFAILHHPFGFQINRTAGGGDHGAGSIQKRYRAQFAGFDKFLQRWLKAFLQDDAAEALRTYYDTESGGDVARAIDQRRPGSFFNAVVLDDLPDDDQDPHPQQHPINKAGAPIHRTIRFIVAARTLFLGHILTRSLAIRQVTIPFR